MQTSTEERPSARHLLFKALEHVGVDAVKARLFVVRLDRQVPEELVGFWAEMERKCHFGKRMASLMAEGKEMQRR